MIVNCAHRFFHTFHKPRVLTDNFPITIFLMIYDSNELLRKKDLWNELPQKEKIILFLGISSLEQSFRVYEVKLNIRHLNRHSTSCHPLQ